MTITAREDDQPDRGKALADIADALDRLRGEPADPVAAEIARLRKDIQALTDAQARHNCHCWCHHGYTYTFPTSGGYHPVTWTYNTMGASTTNLGGGTSYQIT